MPPPRSGPRIRVHPLGDTALLAEIGNKLDTAINTRAIALAAALKRRRDVREAIAGCASVTVQYDPDQITPDELGASIRRLAAKRPPMEEPGRLHRIPIVYDGPDLDRVTQRLGISRDRFIELHGKPVYRAFLVGFVPGWAYLGPLPEQLEVPRLATPRTRVPPGSVAIAGKMTGIYPLESPGGWNLVGRTSVRLFLPDRDPPSLFRAGDRVKFFPATQ